MNENEIFNSNTPATYAKLILFRAFLYLDCILKVLFQMADET